MKRKAAFGLIFLGALCLAGCTGASFNTTTSPAVTSVSVTCTPSNLQPGQTSQCTATITGSGNYSHTVNWSAASGNISSTGIYTAPSTPPPTGDVTIQATSTQNVTKTGVTVVAVGTTAVSPTVTAVTVVATPLSISTAQTATCVATVAGTGAYSSAVTWTATGGTITTGGVFTPSGTGTGTCTAHSAQSGFTNVSGSANITVSATPPTVTVTGVSVVATPSSISTAQKATCVATVIGTGAFSNAVTWTATGGTITSGGVFTPSGAGNGTCTAHSAQTGFTSVSGTANIAVTAAPISATVSGVSVVAAPTSITTAQTTTCVATVTGTGAFSNAVTWTATGGTITSGGVFTPSGAGTGTCTAHSAQAGFTNVSGTASIAVTAAPSSATVTGVSVVATPSSITTAQTATCVATVTGTGAFSHAVTWTATGGTITSGGVFTPSGAGTGSCTAHSAQAGYTNVSGAANIAITSAPFTVTSITVTATPASITASQTSTCAATVSGTGAYSSAVTWTATGGTISAGGVFTPSGSGTATCTAHSAAVGYTNISGSANINVTAASPTITGVTIVCSPSSITSAQTATCTPTVTGTGSFTNTVNLTLSPTANGTLSAASGVSSGTGVTFTPAGTPPATVTITATSTQDSTKSGSTTVAITSTSGAPQCGAMSLGNLASLNGFVPFPASSAWNTDISSAPLDPNSAAIAAGFTADLHPDFSNVVDGNYGIPYTVVDSSTQPAVPINVVAYPEQSDVANAPYSATTQIEGNPGNCVGGPSGYIGDQHVIVLDRNRCMLYETFNTSLCNGTWAADAETIWDMRNNEQRPYGWTSVDAAGLAVFPGLVRYDEVASGAINHALRFTMAYTRGTGTNGGYFVLPATHAAGSSNTMFIMGMRIRLKANVDISSFSPANQVILTAMKKYGMILADNGSNFFFQGTPDARWDDNDLNNLKTIPGSDFEVVQMNPSYPGMDANTAPTGAAPTIDSFTASSSTVASGTPVTLTWSTTNDSYDFIDKIGGVHGGTITVTPTATTTYTLNATNAYGRTTQQVTVVVQ